MASEKLGSWLGVLGNVGLIFGLVLVAYQIKQTNDLAQVQVLNDTYDTGIAIDLAAFGEQLPEALSVAMLRPSDLTDEQLVVLDHFYRAKLFQHMRMDAMREFGVLDQYSEEIQAESLADDLRQTSFGLAYWELMKNGLPFAASFADKVDSYIDDYSRFDPPIVFFRQKLEAEALRGSESER